MSQANNLQIAEADGGPLDVPRSNIWELLEHGVHENPEGAAVVALHQPPNHVEALVPPSDRTTLHPDAQHLSWSYKRLYAAALRVATIFAALGVQQGDRIVVFLGNCIEWAILHWATARLGATWVPMDKRFIQRKDDAKYYLDILMPRVMIVEDMTSAATSAQHALPELDRVEVKLAFHGIAQENLPQWKCLMEQINLLDLNHPSCIPPPIQNLPRDAEIACILFTSGTTSQPKGCLRTVRNQTAGTFLLGRRWRHTRHSVQMMHLASFRAICNVSVISVWHNSATLVFPADGGFEASIVGAALGPLGVTGMSFVPTQVHLLAAQRHLFQDARSVEMVSLSADVITADLIAKAADLFGAACTFPTFGMSEGNDLFYYDMKKGEEVVYTSAGIAGVGHATPGTKIKVCGPEMRMPLARGELGALHVCAPSVIRGYLAGRDAENFYEDENGDAWFITGDQAMMDEKGIVFVLGRYKDIIKIAGVGHSPAVLETALNKMPGVESVVVGVTDEILGSAPVAVLNQNKIEPHVKQQLKDSVVKGVGKEAELRDVLTLDDLGLENLPLNATGKVMRNEVMGIVQQYMDRNQR